MSPLAPNLFQRRFQDLMEIGRAQLPALAPEWTDHNAHDPGITLLQLFAWLAEMPLVLSKDGVGLLSYGSPLGLYTTIMIATFVGPFLSAFIMTAITEGTAGIGHLLRSLVLWRVGFKWYLFALIGLPAIMVLSVIILPGALSSFQGFAGVAPLPTLALFVYIFFLGGPLGEEPGWRGFALPRLQRRYGPLAGSVILGPLWGCWHLPIFWIPAWDLPPTILNIVMFVIATIPFTIVSAGVLHIPIDFPAASFF